MNPCLPGFGPGLAPANFNGVTFTTPQGRRTCVKGLSGYKKTPTPWGWEYYPPPYRFASPYTGPSGVTPDYASASYMGLSSKVLSNSGEGLMGLGCAGGCSCGGACNQGMGQVDLSFLTNTITLAGYQIPVWIALAVGIGAVAMMSGLGDKKR